MLHEIGVQLQAALNAKSCSFRVVDGPEIRKTTTFARERIVLEHDMSAGDTFAPRHRADVNPRTRMVRNMGAKLTIYAQHPAPGSAYWEHKRRAEHVLDLTLIALDVIAKERQNIFAPKSGKFVFPDDLEKSETPGGAVYEFFFTFDRGVADRKWDGTALPTAVISAVAPGTGPGVIIQNSSNVSDPVGNETEEM